MVFITSKYYDRIAFQTKLHQIILENILTGTLTLGAEIPIDDYFALAKAKYPEYAKQKLKRYSDVWELAVKKDNKFYVTTNEKLLDFCLRMYFDSLLSRYFDVRFYEDNFIFTNKEPLKNEERAGLKSFIDYALRELCEVRKYPKFPDIDYGSDLKEFAEILMGIAGGYGKSESTTAELDVVINHDHTRQKNLEKVLKEILEGKIKLNDNITAYLAENLPESADKYDIIYMELAGMFSTVNRLLFLTCDLNNNRHLLCRLLFHCLSNHFHDKKAGENFSLKTYEIYRFYRTESEIIEWQDVKREI